MQEKVIRLPVWYLPGPFFRYVEDVKALAKKAGVRIVDANVTDSRVDAAPENELPKVTLKPEYAPKAPVAPAGGALSPELQAAADAAAKLSAQSGQAKAK